MWWCSCHPVSKTLAKEKLMKKKYQIFLTIVFLLAHTTNLVAQDDMSAKTEIVIKGKYGSADGQFGLKTFEDKSWAEPTAIAIDLKGNMYIADPLNNRIQKFDKAGKFLFKIDLDIQKKLQRFAMTIDDITVDQEDNLYAVSRHEHKIFKYRDRTLIQSINLKEMDIAWDTWRGWRSGIYLQPQRISTDETGNVFVEGSHELIKINKDGSLAKKWVIESGMASHFIDQAGYLYFSKKIGMWEKYDQKGNLLGQVACEKEPLLAFVPPEGECQFPPKFIDKNGFRYFFELKPKTSDLISIIKVDGKGNFKRYKAPKAPPVYYIWQALNMIKFDSEGNLYVYGYDDKKKEYWIMKISLN